IRTVLRELELSQVLAATGARPVWRRLSAWGTPDLVVSEALTNLHGPGWALDRRAFDAELARVASDAATVMLPATVTAVSHDATSWVVACDQRETLRARVAVDATGRRSVLFRGQGLAIERRDQLTAYAVVTRDFGPEAGLLIEAVPEGWWYTSGLPGGRRV